MNFIHLLHENDLCSLKTDLSLCRGRLIAPIADLSTLKNPHDTYPCHPMHHQSHPTYFSCHPEQSEGSGSGVEMLRYAQHDKAAC